MTPPLSPRLRACAGFVGNSRRFADIGCDHSYLSIHLLQNGIATSCIAADVRSGPLESAKRNAEKYGVSERITFCLSDGVRDIPRDFDTLVCAGMGADTMIHILSDAPWLRCDAYALVLQCQSKTHMLRNYLSENGWRITQECVLRDGKFLYTVMEVDFSPDAPRLSPAECYFPPAMLENPSVETVEYYHQMCNKLRHAILSRADSADVALCETLKALEAMADAPYLSFLKEER